MVGRRLAEKAHGACFRNELSFSRVTRLRINIDTDGNRYRGIFERPHGKSEEMIVAPSRAISRDPSGRHAARDPFRFAVLRLSFAAVRAVSLKRLFRRDLCFSFSDCIPR